MDNQHRRHRILKQALLKLQSRRNTSKGINAIRSHNCGVLVIHQHLELAAELVELENTT